jgi:hypothetical protein
MFPKGVPPGPKAQQEADITVTQVIVRIVSILHILMQVRLWSVTMWVTQLLRTWSLVLKWQQQTAPAALSGAARYINRSPAAAASQPDNPANRCSSIPPAGISAAGERPAAPAAQQGIMSAPFPPPSTLLPPPPPLLSCPAVPTPGPCGLPGVG